MSPVSARPRSLKGLRSASKSGFEAHWSVTLGSDVIYVDSTTAGPVEVPTINGSETYTLEDDQGVVQDGPTHAMSSSAGENLQRKPGTAPGNAASWTISSDPATDATPGSGQAPQASPNGIYISEFSDAPGTGNFVYEFVEIHYEGKKVP